MSRDSVFAQSRWSMSSPSGLVLYTLGSVHTFGPWRNHPSPLPLAGEGSEAADKEVLE